LILLGHKVKLPAIMATIENTAVSIADNDSNTTLGQMQTTRFDHADSVKRGLLKLGLFWLQALGSVPIIIAHWVLVPGFFIAGPFVAWRTYKTSFRRDHVDGDCPVCKKTIRVKLEAKDELPKWTYCPDCNNPLQITAAD
jgi:hypothetical protein